MTDIVQKQYSRRDLIDLVNSEPGFAKPVDADMSGNPITDYSVLLWGAYGPAVARIVNIAVLRHGDSARAPITAEQLEAFARDAVALATDYNFATPPQPMRDYSLILDRKDYGYHKHVLALVNLALRHAVAAPAVA